MKKLVATLVALIVVAGAVPLATRWGMWRHTVVHVTGEVGVDFAFDEHSGGPSLQPCRDAVRSGHRPAFELPTWSGFTRSGTHFVEFFGGQTATSDATSIGKDLTIERAGTYEGKAALTIDGHGYTLYVGMVTIRPDGSGLGTLGGNTGDRLPSVVTETARFSWTCRDGFFPV